MNTNPTLPEVNVKTLNHYADENGAVTVNEKPVVLDSTDPFVQKMWGDDDLPDMWG